jgi:hypothetical protein
MRALVAIVRTGRSGFVLSEMRQEQEHEVAVDRVDEVLVLRGVAADLDPRRPRLRRRPGPDSA